MSVTGGRTPELDEPEPLDFNGGDHAVARGNLIHACRMRAPGFLKSMSSTARSPPRRIRGFNVAN